LVEHPALSAGVHEQQAAHGIAVDRVEQVGQNDPPARLDQDQDRVAVEGDLIGVVVSEVRLVGWRPTPRR
jgi:hypothetical protein